MRKLEDRAKSSAPSVTVGLQPKNSPPEEVFNPGEYFFPAISNNLSYLNSMYGFWTSFGTSVNGAFCLDQYACACLPRFGIHLKSLGSQVENHGKGRRQKEKTLF